jgi:hypothetical protein
LFAGDQIAKSGRRALARPSRRRPHHRQQVHAVLGGRLHHRVEQVEPQDAPVWFHELPLNVEAHRLDARPPHSREVAADPGVGRRVSGARVNDNR